MIMRYICYLIVFFIKKEKGKKRRCFFFSSRRRHTIWLRDWSSDVCSSDLVLGADPVARRLHQIRHGDGVRVGAGSLERQPPQQRPAGVGELEQGEVGGDSGDRFRDR